MTNRTDNLTGHGSAYDRGSADRYYGRGFRPHYMTAGWVRVTELTADEQAAYRKGWNEEEDRKEWD